MQNTLILNPFISNIRFFIFKFKFNLKFLWIFVLLAIFSLLIVSVHQLNAYTAEVYFIHSSEKKINQLSQENKILEINLAKANSLGNIGHYVQNFEKAGKIEYIRVLESTVLAK